MNTNASKAQLYLLVQILQLPYFRRRDTSWLPTTTTNAAQIGYLVFQIGHGILLTFKTFLQGLSFALTASAFSFSNMTTLQL